MLTLDELEALRRRVRLHGQGGRGDWYLYADGPLFGIRVRLPENEIGGIHSWCAPGTSGAVVVSYTSNPALHRCFFAGLS